MELRSSRSRAGHARDVTPASARTVPAARPWRTSGLTPLLQARLRAVMKLFRERLRARLIERHAISPGARPEAPGLATSGLLGAPRWMRSPSRTRRPSRTLPVTSSGIRSRSRSSSSGARVNRARLMWRNRFAIPGLDGQKAVLYRSRMNPSLGRNFEAMDPLECWRVWPTISPTPANIAPTSMPTTPTAYAASGRPKNGDGKYEEGAAQEAPLLPKLGEPHRQGLSGGSARLQTLRRPAQGRCLHHRHRRDPPHPGPSRSQPAGPSRRKGTVCLHPRWARTFRCVDGGQIVRSGSCRHSRIAGEAGGGILSNRSVPRSWPRIQRPIGSPARRAAGSTGSTSRAFERVALPALTMPPRTGVVVIDEIG